MPGSSAVVAGHYLGLTAAIRTEVTPSEAEGFPMSRTTRTTRTIPLLLATAATLALSTALPGQVLNSTDASAATQPVTVPAGSDYARATFGDPWDYGNAADLVLDKGPTLGVASLGMSGGTVHFTTHSGYVSPMWGGYANEVPVEREGTRSGNMLDARTYTRMNLHIYVSAPTGFELSWYTCGALRSTCRGVMGMGLRTGWNDVDVPIMRRAGLAWAGRIVGLRVSLGVPSGRALVHLDSLRIYQPLSSSAIRWAAPGASAATLWWTDSAGTINAVRSQHAGPVANAAGSADSAASVTANVAGYAPGTSFWSVAADGTKTLVGTSAAAPLPIIDRPTAAGCDDYATRKIGRPWTFTSTRSLAGRANVTALSFTRAGVLSATNAGPRRNDPSISLPIARGGINTRLYHHLTIVESYNGAFNLANVSGGGTMARVLWQSRGHTVLAQTAPLVTFTGKRSITVDMGLPASQLTDRSGPASQRYPFVSANPVVRLRYDPNEDRGARRWQLYSVRLTADCQTPHGFTVTWHDAQYRAGSTVRLQARSAAGRNYALGSTTERAGLNQYVVSLNSLPRGRYTVIIYVTNPANVTTAAVSTGPLFKT